MIVKSVLLIFFLIGSDYKALYFISVIFSSFDIFLFLIHQICLCTCYYNDNSLNIRILNKLSMYSLSFLIYSHINSSFLVNIRRVGDKMHKHLKLTLSSFLILHSNSKTFLHLKILFMYVNSFMAFTLPFFYTLIIYKVDDIFTCTKLV